MSSVPETCPTCSTDIPSSASKCPGCGRVFGEGNRCPHCHAIAAVRTHLGRTVCAACGKPRVGATDLAGQPSSVGSHSQRSREASTDAMLMRARGRAQRGAGVFSLAGGIAAAVLLAIMVPGAMGLGLAAVGGALAVGLGAFSIRAGARSMGRARELTRDAEHTAVRDLAREHRGVLTAAQAADALGISEEAADDLLTSMIGDGSEVDLEVDNDGVVTYVFHRIQRAAPRVRVDESAGDERDDQGAEAEAAASTESTRRREA